ncbi:MAG: hypothetical protein D6768_10175 [Chloroflexi bacterium]|nr:MAG: hypothetical protein D6768_10175 [Chloroflexota bacterium]
MKAQSILVYAVETVCIALFVLYLGFMTQYYILFYDGTPEMFDYYKQLQVFNKEAFNLAIIFVCLALALLVFDLHKYRPGLVGLALAVGTTVYISLNSINILRVIPKYEQNYLALDFSTMEDYVPSTFAFNAALVLHSILIVLLAGFTVIAIITFIQRLKDGNPLVRKLI